MDDDPQATSLVIGGTGMLAAATRWLSRRSAVTVVVARNASRFTADDPAFRPVDVDWEQRSFVAAVEAALREVPPVRRALIWLHDPVTLFPRLLPRIRHARTVLVLGSRHTAPDVPDDAQVATVRLGSLPTGDGRRWLTHEEICAGAVAALRDGRHRTVGDPVPLDS